MLLASALPSAAHGAFRGIVLAVQAGKGEAVIAHDKSADEPAGTATYRIDAATLAKLHDGDRVAAVEDESTKPSTLRDVMIESAAELTNGPVSPIRNVKQLAVGDKAPGQTLVDQAGKQFTLARYAGKYLVLGFIYTRCRDARECPLTTAKFAELQKTFAKDDDVRLLEVTLDPGYDTPAVLAKYGTSYAFDPAKWTFAGGDQENVLDFDAAFGLNPFADPTVGLIHGETLAIVDPSGVVRDLIYTSSWNPDEVSSDIASFKGKASNPIAQLDLWLSRSAVAMCGNSVNGFDGFFDLLVVIVICCAIAWLFWRLYRAFRKAAD